jgi:RNA polymerase sigma factor (sigma-70 family)
MNQVSVATLDPAVDQKVVAAAEDERLVSAAREGDDRAFEQLYARYRARIRAFALRMTRDPDRADDLVQDVFISALRRLRETDTPISFRPWIYEIARNACIDEYRRRRRIMEVPIDRDSTDGWLDHLPGGPSPEAAIESKQQLEDLCGAFRGLSERHHRIIVARELEGKSYQQIGAELDMSQVVVESTLFRARRRLTEEFQELTTGQRCERVQRIIATADGRRLGVRERRALTNHIEHCQPCRRDAVAAGFGLKPRKARPLQKVAALFFPFPALKLLRRAGGLAHQRALGAAATAARLGQTLGSLAPGRMAAVVAAVAAGVGGGLLSQPGQAPAQAAPRHPAPVVTPAVHRTQRVDRSATLSSTRSNVAPRAQQRHPLAARTHRTGPLTRPGPPTAAPRSGASPTKLPAARKVVPGIKVTAPSVKPVTSSIIHSVTAALGTAGVAIKPPVKLPVGGVGPAGVLRSSRGSQGAAVGQATSVLRGTTDALTKHSPVTL